MKPLKVIIEENKDTKELKNVIEVYEEIAASKMQKVRGEIMQSRDFYDGLGKLADEVGSDLQAVPVEAYQDAAVFVSANQGLYGDIIGKTFMPFLSFIKNNLVKIYVVGKIGEQMMRQYAPDFNFEVINISDETIEEEIFSKIMKQLLTYRKIFVFYGKFKNIAVQSPNLFRISGDLLPKNEESYKILKEKQLNYLYEPSLNAISKFFSQEIISILMVQVLQEAQLAKFGSRMMFLDQSLDKVLKVIDYLDVEKRNARKKLADKKQNIMIAGVIARGI